MFTQQLKPKDQNHKKNNGKKELTRLILISWLKLTGATIKVTYYSFDGV